MGSWEISKGRAMAVFKFIFMFCVSCWLAASDDVMIPFLLNGGFRYSVHGMVQMGEHAILVLGILLQSPSLSSVTSLWLTDSPWSLLEVCVCGHAMRICSRTVTCVQIQFLYLCGRALYKLPTYTYHAYSTDI